MCAGVVMLCLGTAAVAKPGDPVWVGFTGKEKVAIMAPDVEVSLLTAGGLLEPNQEWTANARQQLSLALTDGLKARGVAIVESSAIDASATASLQHLHAVVGEAALWHRRKGVLALPTKKDAFDWTLGSAATYLADTHGVDYALFLFARDSFSSGGRVAMTLLLGLPGGTQHAFATLVNARTGDIVWLDANYSQFGDIRDGDGAHKLIESLFKTLPAGPGGQ